MINKIHHFLGTDAPKRGDLGLELEVEAQNPLPNIEEKSWRTKEDGSLRGFGAEYYSKQPIPCNEVKLGRIAYLCERLMAPEVGVFQDSPRTSFHVHKNVSGFTPRQVWTAAIAYWLVENLLTEFCGETRKGNLFCLRLKDAESVIPAIIRDLRTSSIPFSNLRQDRTRYLGLNLKAVLDFGSLEVRTMRGTLDPVILDTWSTELQNLFERSREWPDPAKLMDFVNEATPGALLGRIFSPAFIQQLQSIRGWEELIRENYGLLCEIAYLHSWDKWEEKQSREIAPIPRPATTITPRMTREFVEQYRNIAGVNFSDSVQGISISVQDGLQISHAVSLSGWDSTDQAVFVPIPD